MAEPRLCHAHACETPVPPSLLFCRPHWFALRVVMQRAVWRFYRKGQEKDKRPSLSYLAVQQRAIAELVFRPNDEAAAAAAVPYLAASEDFRQRAIEVGEGDPIAEIAPHASIDGQAAKDAWLEGRKRRHG